MFRLFLESDNCVEFKTQSALDNYILKYNLIGVGYLILRESSKNKFQVLNPYLANGAYIETFETESEALKYIGSFL